MGMDSQGNIREITIQAPLKPDEVLISEAEKEQLETMSRAERRRAYRLKMKEASAKLWSKPGKLTTPPLKLMKEQSAPKQTEAGRPIWELVIQDMRDRDKLGFQRYGTRLRAHNGRNALLDAYQEALDLAVYLRQAIEERNG
jgi:hypothetical protein